MTASTTELPTRRKQFANRPERLALLFVLPALLLVVLFRVVPLIWGLGYSFTNYDGINPPSFIGFVYWRFGEEPEKPTADLSTGGQPLFGPSNVP